MAPNYIYYYIYCCILGHIKNRNAQVSILAGQDTKCQKNMSDMRVDGSLQKKKKKTTNFTRTHPAYQQSWDTLKRLTLYLNVFSRADASGIHATS